MNEAGLFKLAIFRTLCSSSACCFELLMRKRARIRFLKETRKQCVFSDAIALSEQRKQNKDNIGKRHNNLVKSSKFRNLVPCKCKSENHYYGFRVQSKLHTLRV